jgi:hypothetical protein
MREFLPEIRLVRDGPEIGERHILRYRFEENGWW